MNIVVNNKFNKTHTLFNFHKNVCTLIMVYIYITKLKKEQQNLWKIFLSFFKVHKFITPKSIHPKFLQCHVHWAYTNLIIIDLTFIAVSDTVKVDIVVVIVEEHEGQERVERVDRNDEENAHDPSLLIGTCVVAKMEINLERKKKEAKTHGSENLHALKLNQTRDRKAKYQRRITSQTLLYCLIQKKMTKIILFFSFSHFYCFLICATLPVLLPESVR